MAMITVQLTPDSPITEMDESELVKSVGGFENDVEKTSWVEYRLASDPNAERAVHRSPNVDLKKAATYATGKAGEIPH